MLNLVLCSIGEHFPFCINLTPSFKRRQSAKTATHTTCSYVNGLSSHVILLFSQLQVQLKFKQ